MLWFYFARNFTGILFQSEFVKTNKTDRFEATDSFNGFLKIKIVVPLKEKVNGFEGNYN